MSNSKRDSEILIRLFNSFVGNLTVGQYEKLINGHAEIKLVEKESNSNDDDNNNYLNFLEKLNSINIYEEKAFFLKKHFNQKIELIQLAKFLGVQTKTRDTIDDLIKKIIVISDDLKDEIKYKVSRKNYQEETLSNLYEKFEHSMDVEDAKIMLKGSSIYQNKSELLKFARRFSVYPDKSSSIDHIVDLLVKSVVEAKLRSLKIRQKL